MRHRFIQENLRRDGLENAQTLREQARLLPFGPVRDAAWKKLGSRIDGPHGLAQVSCAAAVKERRHPQPDLVTVIFGLTRGAWSILADRPGRSWDGREERCEGAWA